MRSFIHAAILIALSFNVFAQQQAPIEPKGKTAFFNSPIPPEIQKAIKTVLDEQMKAFACTLTNDEMKTISEKHLKAHPVLFDSQMDPTRPGRILLEAFKKLDGKIENADKVFEEMELEKKGISKRLWDFQLKNNNFSEEHIKVIEELNPKTQEELDTYQVQLSIRMKRVFEGGLLAYRILLEYNKKHKDNPINDKTMVDWGIEASKKKEKVFMDCWTEILAQKYPNIQNRAEVLGILCKQSMMGLANLTNNRADWLPFFQEKIQKWNITQKVED